MTIPSRWQPGKLIPILMILTLLAEVGTRFLPPSSVSTRGTWEAAIRYSLAANMEAGRFDKQPGLAGRIESIIDPRDPRQGSFEINLNIEKRDAFGDLASLGNVPSYRHYRVEDFITDEFGFRNRPGQSVDRIPDALVLGSSYIAQPGVIHEQTLPSLLASRSGLQVYNAATSGGDLRIMNDFLGFIRRTTRRLGMSHGLVIIDYKSGEDDCSIPIETPGSMRSGQPITTERPIADLTRPWAAGLRRWLALSRLQVMSRRIYKSLQNDWLLPNSHAKRLLFSQLPDGQTMLFLPSIVKPRPDSLVDSGVKYFQWLDAQLARDGLKLVVLFVPRPVVIYGDIVKPPLPAEAWVTHYRTMQERLEAGGITVVNPIDSLRREAHRRIANREYLYRLDDTHWNELGIVITVDEILRVLRLSTGTNSASSTSQ